MQAVFMLLKLKAQFRGLLPSSHEKAEIQS